MPNTQLTDEFLIEEVRQILGSSSIEVELDDQDIEVAARRSLRVYNRYLPFQGRAKLAATQAQKKYRIDDLHPGLLGVVDVDFITEQIDPAGVDPFDPYLTSLTGPNYGDETFADVVQRKMYAEDASRIVSAEAEWHGQWEVVEVTPGVFGQQYFLYVDLVRSTIQCSYVYNSQYADTDDPGLGRQAIPEGDVDWFVDHTVALCKQTLARILGKHGGVVGPDGQTDQTDASELRQEAATDLERLILDIRSRRRIGVPITE